MFCSGLVDCGASLIAVHGRTRGSAKHRRAGPADLEIVGKVASSLSALNIPVVANGNISCTSDVAKALAAAHPCVGTMSAEGILKDPAIYICACAAPEEIASHNIDRHPEAEIGSGLNECSLCGGQRPLSCTQKPSPLDLFNEYCDLSEAYRTMGGWIGVDNYESSKRATESKQIYIARQHLVWMLGKTGHGRTVRYERLGAAYRRHTDRLEALNSAKSIEDLRQIARNCL